MNAQLLTEVVENTNVVRNAQVHVFYEGRAWDLDMSALDVGQLSTDNDVRGKVAESLNVPVAKLASFTVDRNVETGDMTLRPQAVFGSA